MLYNKLVNCHYKKHLYFTIYQYIFTLEFLHSLQINTLFPFI